MVMKKISVHPCDLWEFFFSERARYIDWRAMLSVLSLNNLLNSSAKRPYKNIISTFFVCSRTCNQSSTRCLSSLVGTLVQCITTTTCLSVITMLSTSSVPLASVTRVISGSCVCSSAASCAAAAPAPCNKPTVSIGL